MTLQFGLSIEPKKNEKEEKYNFRNKITCF